MSEVLIKNLGSIQGIDLYPPSDGWLPPNCSFEVDDALSEWTYTYDFDLIHIRDLYSSFTDEQ